MQVVEVFVAGVGVVGGCLVDQIAAQQSALRAQGVDVRVCALSNSKRMAIDAAGLSLADWRAAAAQWPLPADLSALADFIRGGAFRRPVFVDCTASDAAGEHYAPLLRAGVCVVTANKRANTQSYERFCELRRAANSGGSLFLYEANVGAGLPVIDALQTLARSGDRLARFSGIVSGSLSFIFGELERGAAFSEAVAAARARGFTEPDPRDDLSLEDVARKVLIVAREAGIPAERSDVAVEPLLPAWFDAGGSVDAFMANLRALDPLFAERCAAARAAGRVMRLAAEVDGGRCRVGAVAVPAESPLASVSGGENVFVFETARYAATPLVIRGYGAGGEVTASAVFGNILRTVPWNSIPGVSCKQS